MSSDDTRERILESAGQLFAEQGFAATTVRTICQKAGVNLAAVNYHFRDKRRLYTEAVKRAHFTRLSKVPLPKWTPQTTAVQKLRDFIHVMIVRLVEDTGPIWQMQLVIREMSEPTEACDELVQEFIGPQFGALQAILREILPPDTPPDRRHMIAFSIVGQCLHYRIARPVVARLVGDAEFHTYTAEKLADHIAGFTLSALGLAPPLPGSQGVAS